MHDSIGLSSWNIKCYALLLSVLFVHQKTSGLANEVTYDSPWLSRVARKQFFVFLMHFNSIFTNTSKTVKYATSATLGKGNQDDRYFKVQET